MSIDKKQKVINSYFSPSLLAMYLDTLLMAIGFFMLVPLLGVYFINHLGWSTALSGTIIACSGIAQNGFRFFCGMLADKIGYKKAILLGVGIRVIGFVLYGIVSHPIGFALAAFISGLGGACFHPASYAAYARLTGKEMQKKIFAIRETLSNTGFVLGPVIGMFLLQYNFTIVSLSAAAMFLLAFLFSWIFLPKMKSDMKESQSYTSLFKDILNNSQFLLFSILIIGIWALNVQLYIVVPVKAEDVLSNSDLVAYLYMAGAIFMVLFQIPLLRISANYLKQSHILGIGSFILGSSMLIFGLSKGLWTLLIAVLIFTLGQMLVIPTMNYMISGFSNRHSFATYFGFTGWSLAIGGFLGNSFGGYLHDVANTNSNLVWLPWASLFSLGCIISIAVHFDKVKLLYSKLMKKEKEADSKGH